MPLQIAGPQLLVAVLCEYVLEEKDGVNSAIRLVDRTTISAEGGPQPTMMPPIPFGYWLLIVARAGDFRGEAPLRIIWHRPNETQHELANLNVAFTGPANTGVTVRSQLNIVTDQPGVHWFEVTLGDAPPAFVPLEIIFQHEPALEGEPIDSRSNG